MSTEVDVSALLRFRPQVRAAAAYVPEWLELDRSAYIRLDRNESTCPVSPHLAAALAEYVNTRGVFSYPESERLAEPLASYCGVPAGFIVPTNGSDQAIDLCLRSFLDDGDRMLVARPEFSIFSHVAELIGVRVEGVPYGDDLEFPYKRFWAAAKQRPELIVVINPNNPTGTAVDVEFIERLATAYPDIPIVVDEAYYEFTGATVAGLTVSHPNVIVLRTFSKAFAMAGLRLGYVIAHRDVASEIKKLRNPFDVNELAVVAGKIQLANLAHVRAHVAEIMTHVKPMVVDFFRRAGVPVWPGAANFLLVRPQRCAEAVGFLRSSGILVRSMSAPALAGMFRMSLGTGDEMHEFVRVYEAYLRGDDAGARHPGTLPT